VKIPRVQSVFRSHLAAVVLALALGLLVGVRLDAGLESIALSSTAAKVYVRPVGEDGKPRLETYVFSPGRFFGPAMADASVAAKSLPDVLKALVPNLAKQNYYPTKDEPNANLAIIVHWGSTQMYETPGGKDRVVEAMNQELSTLNTAIADTGMGDAGALNNVLTENQTNQQSEGNMINFNADLLGYRRDLENQRQKMLPTTEEITMSTELNEERYFVVLMAYDYQLMKKERKTKLLWVTRMSVRAPGNNFTEALPALALAGSDIFGRQLNQMLRVKVPIESGGSVKLHDMKILDSGVKSAVEKAPPEQPAK
jgi:hypothetical protein